MAWALIVATYGRTAEVRRLLESLEHQELRSFRVILVDQNQDDRLEQMVQRFHDRVSVNHIRIPPRGVSQARNVGLSQLHDEQFVAFPDDDCYYDSRTLLNATQALEANPKIDAVIGSLHPIGAPPALTSTSTTVAQVGRFKILKGSGTPTLFFKRSAVDKTGGFDETLGPGAGTPWLSSEDADYLLRAGGLQGTAAHATFVRVYHPTVDASSPGYKAKAFGYGRGRMRILSKHNFPWWFKLANVLHPLVMGLISSPATRRFQWHLLRGRLHEWRHPHHLEDKP